MAEVRSCKMMENDSLLLPEDKIQIEIIIYLIAIKLGYKPLSKCISISIMRIQILYYSLIGILVLPIVSCTGNEDPITPSQYRISWIYSDYSYQLFEYNTSGRISEWKYGDSTEEPFCQSKYQYIKDEGAIVITSEEKRGTDIWYFNEKLYLNQNGTGSHATGNVAIMKDGEWLMMTKNYKADFQYNTSSQLTKVTIVEKRTNDTGWEEPNGLEWFIELDWKENNLVKLVEYSNPTHPSLTKTFTYFDGVTAHYIPNVHSSILRYYYLPLQYQGVFGAQSIGLIKDAFITSEYLNYSSVFSYDISSSIYSPTVEKYSEFINDREIKYTIGWESYDQP
jgi:hypothetical protein